MSLDQCEIYSFFTKLQHVINQNGLAFLIHPRNFENFGVMLLILPLTMLCATINQQREQIYFGRNSSVKKYDFSNREREREMLLTIETLVIMRKLS